jgi:hypothetical protein
VPDGFSADTEQIREHAAKIAEVRDRFAAVTAASAAITRDDAAYGLLCGWMSGILEERHEAQKPFSRTSRRTSAWRRRL